MKRKTRAIAVGAAAAGVLAVVLPTALSHSRAEGGSDEAATAPATREAPAEPLRELAQKAGVHLGTAVNTEALADDPAYRKLVGAQFSSVTPENVMKWETVEPTRGTYDYSQADALVSYAEAHDQLVRGHTLVWYSQLPGWLTTGGFGAAELGDILKKHITDEVTHFKGRIWQWDVVNEAFNDDGSLRNNLWLRALGPDYIKDAFVWAHQADPDAVLFINDYSIEDVNAKSTALYDLVAELRKKGVPVQGVGFQSHLDTKYPAPRDLARNMARFDDLGVQTAITEADVRIPLPAGRSAVQDQDDAYRTLLDGCLATRNCTDFTVWGFSDNYSWVPGAFPGEGQADIYDEKYRPKSAYTALSDSLRLAGR